MINVTNKVPYMVFDSNSTLGNYHFDFGNMAGQLIFPARLFPNLVKLESCIVSHLTACQRLRVQVLENCKETGSVLGNADNDSSGKEKSGVETVLGLGKKNSTTTCATRKFVSINPRFTKYVKCILKSKRSQVRR